MKTLKRMYSAIDLIEAMQKQKLRYAFVKRTDKGSYETLMPFVLCRDFLKDMAHSRISGIPVTPIFNFNSSNFGYKEVNLETTLFAITGAQKLLDAIMSQIDFINKIEKNHEAKLTTMEVCKLDGTEDKCLVIEGDGIWMTTPLGISYYSYLFRQMTYPKPDNTSMQSDDDSSLTSNAKILRRFTAKQITAFDLPESVLKKQITDSYAFASLLHNYYGLYYINNRPNVYENGQEKVLVAE